MFRHLCLADVSSTALIIISSAINYRPFKRLRSDPEKLPPSHALHKLWKLRHTSTNSFIVQHKSEDVHASSTYWVMKLHDEINELLDLGKSSGVSGVLIREEYVQALRAVIEFAEEGTFVFPTDDEEESEQNATQVHDTYFENPFSKLSAKSLSLMGGFILTGHPGIGEYHNVSSKIETPSLLFTGKTVWLLVVLILRLQAGLPSIYQSEVDHMHVFNDEGVFKFNCGPRGNPDWTELERYVPPTAWALVDSNQNLITVPMCYQNRLFVVQASSPRRDRFAWQDKANRTVLSYGMKPWPISELILGYVVYVRHFYKF